MKIAALMCGSLTHVGGYQVFTYELLSRLTQRGHRVTLYVPGKEYFKEIAFYRRAPFSSKPLALALTSVLPVTKVATRAHLRIEQMRHKYDIWQLIGAYPVGYIALGLKGRVPLALRTYGEDIQKDPEVGYGLRLDPVLEGRIRMAVSGMDAAIALSSSVSEEYRALDVPEENIFEIPNGIDVARFKERVLPGTASEGHVPADMPLLLTVGRNHYKKGFSLIPQIARLLKEGGWRFQWLVVGGETEQLEDSIKQAGVEDVVSTCGEIEVQRDGGGTGKFKVPGDELVRLYQRADVFVFPSWIETFGRVLAEAMAAGCAVVTTDAPGCRDVVKDGESGLLAEPGCPEALAARVRMLLQDQDLRLRLGRQAQAAAKKYDWDEVVNQYEEVYRVLIERRATALR